MFPSRLPIDNNQETVPLSPRPFIKTGLAAEESDSSIYIRGANMKRYRLFQNIGLLTAMSFALVSCFKDELVGSRVNSRSNIIGFGISAATTADGAPLTRATQYADSALLMLGRGGADTLYLHASSENNISALDTSVATRGVPVNSSNFSDACGNFAVSAFTLDGSPYMQNVRVDNLSGGIWSSDEKHFWPEDEEMTLDFFAYAPAVFGENQVFAEDDIQYTTSDGKKISFDYTVPGSGESVTNAAELQPDIMFAYNSQNKKKTDSATGSVPLTFYHALAGVKFVAKDITGGTVKSITLKNLSGTGTCTYTFTTGSEPSIVWTDLDQDRLFSQEFDVKVNNQQTGEQDITDKNPETTFMMIPQNIENAVVEILFNDGKTDYTLTGKLFDPSRHYAEGDDDLKTWDAGKIYTYAISTESINWTYVFDVTENIDLKLGQTSDTYTVTSYRYRTQFGDSENNRKPVSWTAEGVSATETNREDDKTTNVDINKIVTSFSNSGNGSNNPDPHTLVITRNQMHTTWDGDEDLKNATPKGSETNPYDLSTSDRTLPMETANCYCVNAPGTYQLPLVYGNAIKDGKPNSSAYDNPQFKDYLNNSIVDPYIYNNHDYQPHDACLVWSDGFYMFENIHLNENKTMLVFTLNKEYMQQANAILAVRDNQGRIMWSWHIWVTERKLLEEHEVQDYHDSSKKYRIMQCNLGWVDGKMVYYNDRELKFKFTQTGSAKEQMMTVTQEGEEFNYKDVGSTYYQWGRKDPIIALRNWDEAGAGDFRLHEASKEEYKYKIDSRSVSIYESIQHPNVYYTVTGSWLNTTINTLWNNQNNGGRGNVNTTSSVKTIYDPSPRGFKIPIPRVFSVFVNGCTESNDICGTFNGYGPDGENHNQYHVYTGPDNQEPVLPFTATGQRADRDGSLEQYNSNGPKAQKGGLWAMYGVYYMTCVPHADKQAYTFVLRKDAGTTDKAAFTYGFYGAMSMARPVRPMEDKN